MKIVSKDDKQVIVSVKIDEEREVLIKYFVGGKEEHLSPLFSGPVWSAMIWENSVQVMCGYIENNVAKFENKSIVELGCGLAVPGVVAGLSAKAASVFLTDRDEDLSFLREALIENPTAFAFSSCRFEAVSYDWNSQPPLRVKGEIILAVECVSADVYGEESIISLANAIRAVSKPDSSVTVYICSERRKNDGLDTLLKILGEKSRINLLSKSSGNIELYEIELLRDL